MKIVVDENMPYAEALFSRVGDVVAVPGRPFPQQSLENADALMVRSVTPVNHALVADSPVRFIGSATAGTDHVNTDELDALGVKFVNAAGCNAIAVVEYVFSALLALAERDGFALSDRTVGIIGAGNVGGRLQARLEHLGIKTLICDPPRADRGDAGQFYALEDIVEQADVLTFHTPLIAQGPYKTWHMLNGELLAKLRPNTIIINACRGAVVDNQALLCHLKQRQDCRAVLDVWEPEPELDPALLAAVDIGTAHIAGYTLEGKARGTTQVFEAWSEFIGQPQQIALNQLLPPPAVNEVSVSGNYSQAMLKRLVHLVYDVRQDDALLRTHVHHVGGFDRLRKQYAERREWSSLRVYCDNQQTATCLTALGFDAKVREVTL